MELAFTILVLLAIIGYKLYCLHEANNPKTYPDYLLKLARVKNKPQYYFFTVVGKKHNIPTTILKKDWKTYIETSKLPKYMIEWLDEGKDYIDKEPFLPI